LSKSPQAFYAYVSRRYHPSAQQIVLNDGGKAISDDATVCELLADEFTKNFSRGSIISDHMGSSEDSEFQMSINVNSVYSVLKHLHETAAGPDGIPALFYKHAASSLARPLCIIFNRSLLQGRVPKDWKLAKVIPLYKGKGNRDASSSYRPISLTSVACKVMERIIVTSLTEFLESKNLITSCQHGFRRGRSTVTNLLECESFIWQCLNSKRSCDVICIDFMRAFDKVSHSLLCKKLKEVGVSGCYLRWFADFLSDRWQYVQYNSARSTLAPVASGVVQGSCTGPLLFNIFINDLSRVIKHCQLSMFADDLKVAGDVTTSDDVALVQSDLDAISEWSVANELPISLPKCCALHYGSSNSKHQYVLSGQRINSVSECADLGVLRSDTFTFQPHVRAVALKAARLAGMVAKMFASHDRDFLVKLFCAYIRPVVEYASPVWSPKDVASCVLLENVQRRFTKRISGMSCLSYEERLDALKLLSLQQRREQSTCCSFTRVSMVGLCPLQCWGCRFNIP
jgi:hypothetical protein